MIRIGILGAARIAPRGIVTPANETLGAEVVAVAARSLDRARTFAAQHSIPMAFGSYAELMIRDDIDLVYCARPPSAHLEWCVAALESGKHARQEYKRNAARFDSHRLSASRLPAGPHSQGAPL